MSPRGKGEGSVYQRKDGLWAVSVELPAREYTPEGKPKRRRKVITSKDELEVIRKGSGLRRQHESQSGEPAEVFEWLTAADLLRVLEYQNKDARFNVEVVWRES